MPFEEIKALRQSGRLELALKLARLEFAKDPENIWTKRNLAWVYYEFLKVNAIAENSDDFITWFIQLLELDLPAEDITLYDSISFLLGKILFALTRIEAEPVQKLYYLFGLAQKCHFSKPSEGYSFLLKGFHKGLKNTGFYIELMDWWGFNNFSEKDFLTEKTINGMEIKALAEQVYIEYTKQLLPKEELITAGNLFLVDQEKRNSIKALLGRGISVRAKIFNKEKTIEFLPKLEKLEKNFPDYIYLPYFHAKILLALGENENVLSELIPYAKKKKNDFWVWEILAEGVEPNMEKVFSCYCKALLCISPDEMLLGVRQKMAEAMVQKGYYNEAKTEIQLIKKVKSENGNRIPNVITEWESQAWFEDSQTLNSNKPFYKKHSGLAEEILYEDTPEELVFVEFVNSHKKILNFIASDSKFGFFKFDRFIKDIYPGEILSVRFNGGSKGGRYYISTCKKTINEGFISQFLKEVEGTVKIKPSAPFGFIKDVFIKPSVISKYKLTNGQNFKGKIIKTYNSKNKVWVWKLI